ncbi:unnamed protein product [Rotaria sp. Silwood2]|nr:unnamed protein product [Rotaria sp. Silwood2]CAF2756989.1 unnamed protein product [Rotaria sp. Silwood2]CAF3106606.1 unnamed protein product [Rotaria sp. Silwood2]CAF4254646.1 unnamed protein product [Rotaria sp. Silwood2]CAF4377801.1 unnamed protein product [Rotaria sp. Silwood2]
MYSVLIIVLGSALRWNQTGVVAAGTGSGGSGSTELKNPVGLVIDGNNTLYIADHHNDRAQEWLAGATSGSTIAGTGAGTGATSLSHPQYIALDKNGYIYVTGHALNEVLRFPPNSPIGTSVAGTGTSGSALSQLDTPTDIVVDDNFNVYVIDSKNQRLMKWPPNATNGIVMISDFNSDGVVGLLFAPGSTDEVYLSDSKKNCIYLWKFNDSAPTTTLTQVNSTTNALSKPQGIVYDSSNNMYVADNGNDRVVMYSVNSTVGIPVVGGCSTTPVPNAPMDVAFDSNLSLYVTLDGNEVVKYALL